MTHKGWRVVKPQHNQSMDRCQYFEMFIISLNVQNGDTLDNSFEIFKTSLNFP